LHRRKEQSGETILKASGTLTKESCRSTAATRSRILQGIASLNSNHGSGTEKIAALTVHERQLVAAVTGRTGKATAQHLDISCSSRTELDPTIAGARKPEIVRLSRDYYILL
jgi:hypothetical protein